MRWLFDWAVPGRPIGWALLVMVQACVRRSQLRTEDRALDGAARRQNDEMPFAARRRARQAIFGAHLYRGTRFAVYVAKTPPLSENRTA